MSTRLLDCRCLCEYSRTSLALMVPTSAIVFHTVPMLTHAQPQTRLRYRSLALLPTERNPPNRPQHTIRHDIFPLHAHEHPSRSRAQRPGFHVPAVPARFPRLPNPRNRRSVTFGRLQRRVFAIWHIGLGHGLFCGACFRVSVLEKATLRLGGRDLLLRKLLLGLLWIGISQTMSGSTQ
jgi:hypothetical protein